MLKNIFNVKQNDDCFNKMAQYLEEKKELVAG